MDVGFGTKNGTRKSLRRFLAIIARRYATLRKLSPSDAIEFDLPLTREAMSDYLGLTLETVSRQINALKKDGVIELIGKRHVRVPDMQLLVIEAGDDADGGFIT